MRPINDRELAEQWVRFFGYTTAGRLLGWCALTVALYPRGVPMDRRHLLLHGWGAVSTRYRNVALLDGFKAHLTALGLTVDPEGIESEKPAALLMGALV